MYSISVTSDRTVMCSVYPMGHIQPVVSFRVAHSILEKNYKRTICLAAYVFTYFCRSNCHTKYGPL